MEELLKNANGSIYKLVTLASKRALELSSGSEKLVETAPDMKLTSVALKEIKEQKVSFKVRKS